MTDFNGKVQGSFVDDDDIVRTGRAMIELDGYGFMQVPIPTGLKQAWDDLRGESSSSLSEIRSKAAQAAESSEAASKSATAAKTSETNAASSKNAAASSAAAAGKSESNAASSAAAAKQSETAAAGSASSASSSAAAAKTSESNAASSASAAKTSQSAAESALSGAKASESAAATSAGNAEKSAGAAKAAQARSEEIATSTSWDGDKLTVNGKTSPSLTGPPGPKGDTGSVENVSWADISGKPDLASTWEQVKNKPATFPPSTHTHTSIQITDATNAATANMVVKRDASGRAQFSDPSSGADAATKAYVDAQDAKQLTATEVEAQGASPAAGKVVRRDSAGQVLVPTTAGGSNTAVSRSELTSGLAGKANTSHTHTLSQISDAPNSHTSSNTANTLMSRDSAGRARVSNPYNSLDVANKAYVDAQVAGVPKIQVVSSLPSSPDASTVYIVV